MPLNANGLLQRVHSWVADRDAGIDITAARFDAAFDNIIDAVNQLIQGQIDFKGALKTVFGTTANPAYSFADDDDTGIARTAANTLAVVSGGAVSALFTTLGPAFADGKLITDFIAEQIAPKANTADVDAALALKADQAAVDSALALKADQTALVAGLAPKADTATVNSGLSLKADQTDVDLKADQAAVDSALALKSDTTFMLEKFEDAKPTITQNASITPRMYGAATEHIIDEFTSTITPKSSTAKILITINISHEAHQDGMFFMTRDGVEIGSAHNPGVRLGGMAAISYDTNTSSTMATQSISYLDTPQTTSAITYRLGVRFAAANPFPLNRSHSDPDNPVYERATSRIILQQF